jgi:hypothetical protein
MILRAIFWIGVVALLMPREPDLGFGRPAAPGAGLVSGISTAVKHRKSCESEQAVCAATLGVLDRMKLSGIRSLAEVRTEIEQAERARGG